MEKLRKNLHNNFLIKRFSVKQKRMFPFLQKNWFYDTALQLIRKKESVKSNSTGPSTQKTIQRLRLELEVLNQIFYLCWCYNLFYLLYFISCRGPHSGAGSGLKISECMGSCMYLNMHCFALVISI